MSQIFENIFKEFCALSQKIQKIQTKATQEEVTPKQRVAFHKELESIQGSLEKLRSNAKEAQDLATNSFRQLEDMDKQVISLYRIVEERFEEFEISLISKDAIALGRSLEKGAIFKVAKQVNELRHNIQFLFKNRMPSMGHRKIINLALKLSNQAQNVLTTKGKTSLKQLKMIQLLKSLLREAIANANLKCNPFEEELAMELYEIADLFDHRKRSEGLMRLNLIRSRLTPAQRRRIDRASDQSREMVKILIEIAEGDPCLEWDMLSDEHSVICEIHA